jgi:hypothetical protein
MDRQRHESKGHVTLVLLGEGGAVTLEAWRDPEGNPIGILGIHEKPGSEETRPGRECEYVPGGRCLPDQSFIAGQELAPDVLAGYESRAWTELHQWFTSRLGGGEEVQ